MPAVITIDQRASRQSPRRVHQWAKRLNNEYRDRLLLPFNLTLGDEIQGVVDDSDAVVEIVLEGVREKKKWWLGLGLGKIERPLARTATESRGPAFYAAREAVMKAKTRPYGFAVRSEDQERANDLQTVFELIAFIVRKRGNDPNRWRAIELARAGASTVEVGKRLKITQQAASSRLRTAGLEEEMEGRELARRMLRPYIAEGSRGG